MPIFWIVVCAILAVAIVILLTVVAIVIHEMEEVDRRAAEVCGMGI
jgi:uncharacterized membrane protein